MNDFLWLQCDDGELVRVLPTQRLRFSWNDEMLDHNYNIVAFVADGTPTFTEEKYFIACDIKDAQIGPALKQIADQIHGRHLILSVNKERL